MRGSTYLHAQIHQLNNKLMRVLRFRTMISAHPRWQIHMKSFKKNCVLFGLTIFLAHLSPSIAIEITGKVVSVADGDTITILDISNRTSKIRFSGIDAPEKSQPFGQKSKQSLSELVFGKTVSASCPKSDRYERLLCVVSINGRDIGLTQIERGYAWWYKHYAKDQTREQRMQYPAAEDTARSQHLGLWQENSPTPPWDWRKNMRQGKVSPHN